MAGRDSFYFTALLSRYSRKGLFKDALMVFHEMHRSGVKANEFTYGSTLMSCTKLKYLGSGKQVQGCAQKNGFIGNLFVQSALVDLHSKCGFIEDASYIFEAMSLRDLISWNGMIGGYAVKGFVDESFKKFQSMLREGVSPDHFTLGSLLGSCNQSLHLSRVCQLHAFVLQLGFDSGSHVRLGAQLVDAYAKCGNLTSSSHVFKTMPQKDLLSYTTMINGYARGANNGRDAVNLFVTVHQSGIVMDDVLLCSMLNICANGVSLSLGRQIHTMVLKLHAGYDVATSNSLIDMYAKCGELDEANRAFDELEGKNIISWSSLIGGYAQHGCGSKVIETFKVMEDKGFVPNHITFLSLLLACNQNGLVTDGLECLNSMINKYGIAPREKHYSCMVDLLGRCGHVEEAIQLIDKMNIEPSPSMWSAILRACSVYNNVSLGEVAVNQLFQLDPGNCSYYVVLSGIYAAAGLWDPAWITRRLIKVRNLKKIPGCSSSLVME
ncbi:hypothetical protein Dimus_006541 [Dionaea muscipula]